MRKVTLFKVVLCVVLVGMASAWRLSQRKQTHLQTAPLSAIKRQNIEVAATGGPFQPLLPQVTLEWQGRQLPAANAVSPVQEEYLVSGKRLTLKKNSVSALDADGHLLWAAKSRDGSQLQWMAADSSVAYLQGYRSDPTNGRDRFDSPPCLRRLNLQTGKWLDDLVYASACVESTKHTDMGIAVLADKERVVVLSAALSVEPESFSDGRMLAYRVTCFDTAKTRPLWSNAFTAVTEREDPGVALLASRRPNEANSALQSLGWLGENLLVCSGPRQTILCLQPTTGTPKWRLDRVWEYERGFIGPSVWQHFISRFGIEGFEDYIDNRQAKQTAFEKRYHCALVAGPIIMPPLKTQGGESSSHFFIAVSRGPVGTYSGYLADCLVYECNQEGKPLTMATLPRQVKGDQYAVMPDGVVWKCQNQALVKIARTGEEAFGEMGPGGPDLLTRLDWYRQFSSSEPAAWLVADPEGEATAFSSTRAYCIHAGGYVKTKASQVYEFPLSVIDLQTGLEQTMTLRVPFHGLIPEPTTNYRGDGKSYHTRGSYLLAITRLQIVEHSLRITLGMENWTATVDFRLSDLQDPASLDSKPTAAKPPMPSAPFG